MSREREDRPVVIANCSGFFGDRSTALAEVVRGGPIDFVTGDYLAEVTMLVLAKTRLKDPSGGYAALFLRQLKPVLTEIAERGIRVVVNAGGLNPGGMADAVRAMCAEAGVDLTVAHVEGDDLTDCLAELQADGHQLENLDTGDPLSSWGREPLTANAYLGAWGIVAALDGGADIVICPRVTDASVVVGAAAWWHQWARDDWDQLAGAVAAGHVIECGTQATGGNYSGFQTIADLDRPGFPLAEIAADGSSVITKHPGTSGEVTVGTVTAQLLYEVQGVDYLNPDVTTRLDSILLNRDGPSRVRLHDTKGYPPPATTKVALTALGGFQNLATFVLTGLNITAKAVLVERVLRQQLGALPGVDELRFSLIGHPTDDPRDQLDATCLLQVAIRGEERVVGRAFFDAVVELALANYPGLHTIKGDSRTAKSFGTYWPAIVPQDVLRHRTVLPDGKIVDVAVPPRFQTPEPAKAASPLSGRDWGETRFAPIGALFDARSGDKGGNANVGLWARNDDAFVWLRDTLTLERLRALLPEIDEFAVLRYELPNLRALNFVVKGLLGGGATESMRVDNQAKGFSEYVRAKHLDIPVALLDG
jgi:hypothetical protein